MNKRAFFPGRWQPFHNGHKWLINQKLERGIPVLVAVFDTLPDRHHPFTAQQTLGMISTIYRHDNVKVIIIPDIESVNWGRGVGYETNEHVPPEDIGCISATEIRKCIENQDGVWKSKVDASIHDIITHCLTPATPGTCRSCRLSMLDCDCCERGTD